MNSRNDGRHQPLTDARATKLPNGKEKQMSKRQLRNLQRACDHSSGRKLQWRVLSGGKAHLRSNCLACGGYLGYVPQTPENLEEALSQHNECVGCTWDEVPQVRTLPRPRVACDHPGLREFRWHLFRDGTLHLKSSCGECGVHVSWAPQTFANLQEALNQRRPPINCTWDEALARQPVEDPETVEVMEF